MTRTEIDTLVSEFLEQTVPFPQPDRAAPRVRVIASRLFGDLFAAIEDLGLTADEVRAGLGYIQECGQKREIALLAAGLGLERFLDIRGTGMDGRESTAWFAGGASRGSERPLYVWGAPECEGFAILDDGTDHDRAEILFMHGKVVATDGTPLPKARVEVWHANPDGEYSCFDARQTPFNLRRVIIADEEGEYGFRSIVPAGYECPQNGPARKLLDLLGRPSRQPARIHFSVSAPDHRALMTHIAIDGDTRLRNECALTGRDGPAPDRKWVCNPEVLEEMGLSKPFSLIEYDVTLVPEQRDVWGQPARQKRAGVETPAFLRRWH
ncbi:Catechol 1,2-dioxygenase [uncultured delta proteobacterium]|uniref:Catechol 1,2-dioxygenase n=1 Tax=uncultured delta proteobacterium TaxID=34034 RepID=A0A212J3B5_9DELT|nr:Catechol 1,2-dioxygenase [uncultured delta proteobacterium]